MARETKVGLLVGMGVILLIGIILSDHLSVVQHQKSADLTHFAGDSQDRLGPLADGSNDNQVAPTPPSGLPLSGSRVIQLPNEGNNNVVPATPNAEKPDLGKVAQGPGPTQPKVETPAPAQPMAIHVVKPGDTLYQLARQYYKNGDQWEVIEQANLNLVRSKGNLKIGDKLVIPRKPAPASLPEELQNTGVFEQVPSSTNDPAPAPTSGGVSSNGGYRVVVVESGETLTDIAQDQLGDGQRWNEILELNKDKLKRPQDLQAGMKLKLPKAGASDQTTAPPASDRTQIHLDLVPVSSAKTYTVQSGDTLSLIAAKTLGSKSKWDLIYSANRKQLASPEDLKVGQVLILPAAPGR